MNAIFSLNIRDNVRKPLIFFVCWVHCQAILQPVRQTSRLIYGSFTKTSFFFIPPSRWYLVFYIYLLSLSFLSFFSAYSIHPYFLCLLPACNIVVVVVWSCWMCMHARRQGNAHSWSIQCKEECVNYLKCTRIGKREVQTYIHTYTQGAS